MGQPFAVSEVAMDGSVKTFTSSDNVIEIHLAAKGGDITMRDVATDVGSEATWPIDDGAKEVLQGRSWMKTAIYFKGAAPAVLHIRQLTGPLS